MKATVTRNPMFTVIRRALGFVAAAGLAFALATPAVAYTPKVTKADIKAAGGSCAGNLCVLNGTMWDCTGGGYCVRIIASAR